MVRMFVFLAILLLSILGLAGAVSAASDAVGTQVVDGSVTVVPETRGVAVVSPPDTTEPSIFSREYWQEIRSWEYWQEGSTNTSRSDIARNFFWAVAAFIGLGLGIFRVVAAHRQARASLSQAKTAYHLAKASLSQAETASEHARFQLETASEQARIAEQRQITNRFSTAVEHLGSEQLPVRLGGIYALWRLVQDSPERDVVSVVDILCAFVRHAPHPPADPVDDESESASKANVKVRPDVQAILNLIGDEGAKYRDHLPSRYRLDLTHAYLRQADFSSAVLSGTKFSFAVLSRAYFMGANLTGARFVGADLSPADLIGAKLTGATLSFANLSQAKLIAANLIEADLSHSNLSSADFSSADLRGADLSGADLSEADLSTANNLTQAQLDNACTRKGEKPPKLSEGLKPPTNICGEE